MIDCTKVTREKKCAWMMVDNHTGGQPRTKMRVDGRRATEIERRKSLFIFGGSSLVDSTWQ